MEEKIMITVKKRIAVLIAFNMLFGIAACAGPENSSESHAEDSTHVSEVLAEEEQPEEEEGVLVAYFSATGNTENVAENIAEITGGDLYEIVPAEPYTSEDLDYGNDQSRTSLEMNDPSSRPGISGEELVLDGYSVIYLGYPIWHGQAPRIMDTFVEKYDLEGLTVIPFCTSGSSGIGSSAESLEELAGSGNWKEGRRFDADVSQEELMEWIESLQ